MDPESLTARIIEELKANPEARPILLRALLTDEFLAVPARLIRVETDVSQLKTDMVQVKADITQLKTDVADLKGTDLEVKSVRRIQSIVIQRLGVRVPVIVQSLTNPMTEADLTVLHDAEEQGNISEAEVSQLLETDVIIRARRRAGREPLWIAVEVSNTIDQHDITRAHERATILAKAHRQDASSVVVGRSIRPHEQRMADQLGVNVFVLVQ